MKDKVYHECPFIKICPYQDDPRKCWGFDCDYELCIHYEEMEELLEKAHKYRDKNRNYDPSQNLPST
ncbi:MAG: hypothetical protein ACTSVW_00390 [Candidatus Njordarchaeales archaeon]